MFKEFKISDVFYKIDTPKIKAKANDFPTEYSKEYCVPLLTAGAENQGLNRYAKISDCPMIINNAISVSANGANSGICFYQPHDFAVLQDAYAVKVNEREIDGVEEGLYLTGALNKAVRDNHDWVNKAGWNHIKDDSIELPVIENSNPDHEYTVEDIDWQYMRARITELERDRITELDAYLQATGLNDYKLTEDDKRILSLERASDEEGALEGVAEDEVKFGEFDITKIFTVKNTKCIMQNQIVPNSGDIPYLTAGDGNNAVSTYIACPKDWMDEGNCVFIGGKTLVITYQEKDFCSNDSHNLALYLNNDEFKNPHVYRYMVGALKAALSHKYYWGDSISRKKIQNDKMLLPIKSDGTPDFDYMECYIRAIEKVVIADVVEYKDKVIDIKVL